MTDIVIDVEDVEARWESTDRTVASGRDYVVTVIASAVLRN